MFCLHLEQLEPEHKVALASEIVKCEIGKTLIFIYCVGARQKWSKSGSLRQNPHFTISASGKKQTNKFLKRQRISFRKTSKIYEKVNQPSY